MKLKKSHKSQKLIKKKYNFGLGILKVILAFSVVRAHCFNYKSTNNKIILLLLFIIRRIHVPSFFIMSFNFLYKELILININLFIKRLERLIIPYIGWPLIIYTLNNFIINKFFKIKTIYSLREFKNQLLWANGHIHQFWFQWDLIFMTIIFYLFLFIFQKRHLFFIQLFGFFAYVLQYSEYNKKFYNYLSNEKKQCLGRFCEMIPFASTGFTLASLNIINILLKQKIKTFIFSLLIFYSVEKYSVFSGINGIKYSGIKLNIKSLCIIFIFSLFPSDKIKNIVIENILKYVTSYTAGIFYLHVTVSFYFKEIFKPIKDGNLTGLIIIYLICYIICFIGMKIFGKTKMRNLFS